MRNVMVRAWEIYKTLEGDHLAKLAMALRMAWTEIKVGKATITEAKVNELIKMGAKRWTKSGRDRLYINNAGAKIIGLSAAYRKNGKIDCYYLNGDEISNGAASNILNTYSRAYIDLDTGALEGVNDYYGIYCDLFVKKFNDFINKIA